MRTLVLTAMVYFTLSAACLAASDPKEEPSREDQIRRWVTTRVHQVEPTPTYVGGVIQLIRSKKALRHIDAFAAPTNVLLDFPFPVGEYQDGTIVPSALIAHGRRYVVVAKQGVDEFWIAQVDDDDEPKFYRADLSKLRSLSAQ